MEPEKHIVQNLLHLVGDPCRKSLAALLFHRRILYRLLIY